MGWTYMYVSTVAAQALIEDGLDLQYVSTVAAQVVQYTVWYCTFRMFIYSYELSTRMTQYQY